MKISDAARLTKLTPKAIRYYEEKGLITSNRLGNDYRDYSENNIRDLKFIQRARELGFHVDSCSHLLELYRDPSRASAAVQSVAVERLAEINQQMEKLETMKATLTALVDQCPGNSSPNCTIINKLADNKPKDTRVK